jgi:rSAM/selenodomain-associated transferase 1
VSQQSGTRVIVFAKAPEPGAVKTRLQPALSPVAAARVYTHLLRHAVEQACAAGVGPVSLLGAPDCRHPFLRGLARRHGLELGGQRGADLGARMFTAMEEALARFERVILVGSDLINLGVRDIRDADVALRTGARVVINPTCDGGYGLIAANRVHAHLFEGIPWSSPRVMALTLAAAGELGWSVRTLRLLRDLDQAPDLALIPREWQWPVTMQESERRIAWRQEEGAPARIGAPIF